jgi:hypothetical protein
MTKGYDTSSKGKSQASPWFHTLADLQKHKDVASQKRAYSKTSNDVLQLFGSTENLHVLHIKPEDNPDQLLRLHMFLQATNTQQSYNAGEIVSAGALIIADSKTADNEGFNQAFWATKEHTNVQQVGVFKGNGYLFDNVALVRGVTDGSSSTNAISRVQLAIKNHTRQMQTSGIIWHECTVISLLASMVKNVAQWQASFGSAPLRAVAISSGLSMDRTNVRIGSGLPGQATTSPFLALMRSLNIPIVFIDAYMLGIHSRLDLHTQSSSDKYYSRAATLPRFTEVFPILLPPAMYDSCIKKNMDDLAVNIYRLTAAHSNTYDNALIDKVKKDFRSSKSNWWAKRIVDRTEFTSEKCKRSVSTHLLNIALNSDAPVNFALTAFPSALLDLGRNTSSLMALRCEINFSGPKLRASTATDKNNPLVYILVSKSTKAVINRLHTDWKSLLQTVVPQGKVAKIDRTVAGHWLYMVKVLRKQVDALYKAKDFSKLKDGEKKLFQGVYWALMNGAMSRTSTGTLDTTPYEYWK